MWVFEKGFAEREMQNSLLWVIFYTRRGILEQFKDFVELRWERV